MASLNVVHVPRRYVKDEWGGTETVILETSKRLLARGHETSIHCPLALSAQRDEVIDGVQVHRYPYFYPYWGLKPGAQLQLDKKGGNLFSFSLWRALKRLPHLDLIHLHTGNRLGGIGRTVAARRNIPYVLSLHGGLHDIPQEEFDNMAAPLKGAVEWGKALGMLVGSRRVMHEAGAILCVGQSEQIASQKALPHKRVIYLPNGVDPARFAKGDGARFRQLHNIAPDAKVLLLLSRVDPQKNQRFVVQALPELLKEEPGLVLVVVGPATNAAYRDAMLEDARAAGVLESLRVVPGLAPDDPLLIDAYHGANVFVLPSIHEPFGIVILEAWAAGLPVLASNIGGIPYFVEDGKDGMLFNPREKEDLIRAFRALKARGYEACAEAGHRKMVAEYTWDAITDRLVRIYEEVIDAHRAKQA
ncbi:MAG: glycosyltransferase family 4 protein [Candidatus Hydrogenedentes bacterium]|nr:glycosyltransferase family 4 protein [Candidatus Hydrogenedentota bacterium]